MLTQKAQLSCGRRGCHRIGGRAFTAIEARAQVHALQRSRNVVVRSGLGDAVDGWLDLAKLVAGSGGGAKTAYDELASDIGRDIYVDLAGWHLYLRDMSAGPNLKMHVALASQFGPQTSKGLRESDVSAVLKKVPVKLGAGKTQLSLLEIMPSMCVGDLTRILEDHGRRK